MQYPEHPRRQKIAQRIWPPLADLPQDLKRASTNNILGTVTFLPFAILSIAWFMRAGDPALVWANPWLFLLLVALYLAFDAVGFFWVMEIAPGRFADFETSLQEFMLWVSLLLLGPTAIWTWLVVFAIKRIRMGMHRRTAADRWNLWRNLVIEITSTALGLALALPVYRGLGGRFPLTGLSPQTILPALAAMLVFSLASILPLSIYFLSSLVKPTRQAYIFLFAPSFLPALVNPIAILAASLYASQGVGAFLFLIAIPLLGSLLANRLSAASERSRRQAGQLAALEALGRALIAAPIDASGLPALLEQHVPGMTLYSRIEIRLFPERILLHTPAGSPEVSAALWKWLQGSPRAAIFSAGQAVPWAEQPTPDTLLILPIFSEPEARLLGGIYLSIHSITPVQIPNDPNELLPAFRNLAALIAAAIHRAELYEQAIEHQAVLKEIELAARIQADLLPESLPHLDGWQFSGILSSARQTSGDFFDAVELPDGRWGLLIADVADKGLGAALFMALSRTLLRTYVLAQEAPGAALASTNRRILEDTRSDQFVTVFLGVLDPASGRLEWASAGHNPALLLRPGGETLRLERSGMALGVLPDIAYRSETLQMAPGDALVIYTDGITDAANPQGEFFDEERLLQTVSQERAASARQMRDAVLEAVRLFSDDAPPTDDLTLLVIKRNDQREEQLYNASTAVAQRLREGGFA